MIIRINQTTKEDQHNYIEIDLTEDEMENIKKGRYPSQVLGIHDEKFLQKSIIVSVGINK